MRFLIFLLLTTPCLAQDTAQRVGAIPFLVSQRNNAMDSLALCQGEGANLTEQLASLKKELETVKAELSKLKENPP